MRASLPFPETGKRSAPPLVPPKPSLMSSSRPGLAAYSGHMGQAGQAGAGGGDPNRLAVLAQTSAQSSVESGPDTTTEGSVYRGAIQHNLEMS